MSKKKFYVVWKGRKKGVFSTWIECKTQVENYINAKYKSFVSLEEAKIASKNKYEDYVKIIPKTLVETPLEDNNCEKYILESLSVDVACSGNPGIMEYKGVITHNRKVVFNKGPFNNGTNNVGEFLALVHGIALLSKKKENMPIYSDSKIALSWVKQKKCKTKLQFNNSNKDLLTLIKRAEKWLETNTYKNPILKWNTKLWGEIPADFNRK